MHVAMRKMREMREMRMRIHYSKEEDPLIFPSTTKYWLSRIRKMSV